MCVCVNACFRLEARLTENRQSVPISSHNVADDFKRKLGQTSEKREEAIEITAMMS